MDGTICFFILIVNIATILIISTLIREELINIIVDKSLSTNNVNKVQQD